MNPAFEEQELSEEAVAQLEYMQREGDLRKTRLAGPETDKLVAEKIGLPVESFTTDIKAAFKIVEKLRDYWAFDLQSIVDLVCKTIKDDGTFICAKPDDREQVNWKAKFSIIDFNYLKEYYACGPTPELAICRALLMLEDINES